ncbi:MAG: hypothetical protein AB8G95_25770 [Anaerolineae bacterium]
MVLKQKLEDWDQKSAGAIQAIYLLHHLDNCFISELLDLIPHPMTETGATWLLKAHLERSQQLSSQDIAQLFTHLSKLNSWEAKLHILQCLPYLQIDEACKSNVETFIRDCLLSKNKFVRAWAYGGFFELSNQYSEFSKEFERLFENALENESPSVKARLRNLKRRN